MSEFVINIQESKLDEKIEILVIDLNEEKNSSQLV